MIKVVAGSVHSPVVLLGLSGENMTSLMADEPILVKLKELHPDLPNLTILLMEGKTEKDISDRWAQVIL